VKRLLITFVSLIAALGLAGVHPGAALADDGDGIVNVGPGDTAAVAVNTKDGSSLFKLAFAIKRVAGDVVDNGNAAVAFASCSNCRTVAISIQIVLVTGNPSTVRPENVALAVNQNCTSCETLASAYQFVISTHGPVRFTKDGRREIHDILKELRELKKSELPIPELQGKVDALMTRLAAVLKNDDERDTVPTQTQTTPTTDTTPTVTTETTPTETGTTTTTAP
jgi:putative peptide zinc metalloprotease protein